jgi:hypothetical protein
MKHNMGTADRVIRAVVALLLAYLVFSKAVGGALAVILGIVALAMAVTAIFAYCPPYQFLGIKTCKCDEHGEDKPAEA